MRVKPRNCIVKRCAAAYNPVKCWRDPGSCYNTANIDNGGSFGFWSYYPLDVLRRPSTVSESELAGSAWQAASEAGRRAFNEGNYSAAEREFRNALAEAELLPSNQEQVASTLIDLSEACRAEGKFDQRPARPAREPNSAPHLLTS